MSDKSKIEWTDATWNPVTGCTKVSAGCRFCYAERAFPRVYPGRAFTDVRMHPERLNQPLRWKRPRRIFVNSMSDLFHPEVTADFISRVFYNMAISGQHTFQVLTKRPQRMREILSDIPRVASETNLDAVWLRNGGEWPLSNVWLGVSVEDQKTADERIPLLLQTPAAVRWVSYEPALATVNFDLPPKRFNEREIDWIVAGGESGPKARPSDLAWFRSVRDQCRVAGIPFFMKQITEKGRKIPFDQWPKDLMVREYPDEQAI